ncbi:unnamed protein product [Soboliphyme baturini]|uniref:Uncharacterized protein n=1 Tax=Soboliphyme baturini TaxID=241478 RepID=A0A183J3E1_9BILA|nr:unnamed protein product [Soboliphyme baturini]
MRVGFEEQRSTRGRELSRPVVSCRRPSHGCNTYLSSWLSYGGDDDVHGLRERALRGAGFDICPPPREVTVDGGVRCRSAPFLSCLASLNWSVAANEPPVGSLRSCPLCGCTRHTCGLSPAASNMADQQFIFRAVGRSSFLTALLSYHSGPLFTFSLSSKFRCCFCLLCGFVVSTDYILASLKPRAKSALFAMRRCLLYEGKYRIR